MIYHINPVLIPGDPFTDMNYYFNINISNHMPSKVWDEIVYSFLNFNGCIVKKVSKDK